jgi:sulfur-oxidizing protein SoxZ
MAALKQTIAPAPRVMVPASAAKDTIFTVKTLIAHRMETGLLKDEKGNPIPRKIINKFSCRYNSVEVFRTDLHEAMAANPFIEFHLRATESGRLDFVWEEDGGAVFALAHDLVVA